MVLKEKTMITGNMLHESVGYIPRFEAAYPNGIFPTVKNLVSVMGMGFYVWGFARLLPAEGTNGRRRLGIKWGRLVIDDIPFMERATNILNITEGLVFEAKNKWTPRDWKDLRSLHEIARKIENNTLHKEVINILLELTSQTVNLDGIRFSSIKIIENISNVLSVPSNDILAELMVKQIRIMSESLIGELND
jgi:hypothetical protein